MLISVIVPCFNVEEYIEECIEYLGKMTGVDLEIICVDNNSTDNTLGILKQLEVRSPGKIKVYSESRKGAPYARNLGLSYASGTWIQFLDADDLLLPDKLIHQLLLLENINGSQHEGVVAGAYLRKTISGHSEQILFEESDIYKLLFSTRLGITSANLFLKEAVVAVGGWNTELKSSQEYDLMFRILQKGFAIVLSNKADTIIRERERGQISQSDPVNKWKRYLDLRIRIIDYLKKEHASYFENEQFFFYNSLFSIIRVLSRYDLSVADEYRKRFLPDGFYPQENKRSLYSWLFRILGFKNTEKLYLLLK